MPTADVAVIGAGVTGLSIAFHLARRGLRVVVLESHRIAGGATGKSAGGIRLQFSDEVNIRLALHSVAVYERFEEEFGTPCDFRQHGYLMLATTPDEEAAFGRNIARQRALGVPVRALTGDHAAAMVPGLRTDDVRLAAFGERDGYADPYSVAMGFASAGRRIGVEIVEDTPVEAIDVVQGRVAGVRSPRDSWACPIVVDAAGPWAAEVARLAGVHLPITPYRRQVFVTGPFLPLPAPLPMVIDFRTHFYFRREGAGILFGMTDPDEPPGFYTQVEWSFLARVVEQALHRVPVLATAGVMRGWAGLYDTTPDNDPILGTVPELAGFVVAAGFSGHGFMLAPAVGACIAEMITMGQAVTVDVAALGIGRFRDGRRREESAII
jgi:sarcosine oxidase subunit beta